MRRAKVHGHPSVGPIVDFNGFAELFAAPARTADVNLIFASLVVDLCRMDGGPLNVPPEAVIGRVLVHERMLAAADRNLYTAKASQYALKPRYPDSVFTPDALAGEGVR